MLRGRFAEQVKIMSTVVRRRKEVDGFEVGKELRSNVLRRVVRTAQARSRRALEQDDQLASVEGFSLRVGQPRKRDVVLPERGDEERPTRLQDSTTFRGPGALGFLRQVREDGERIDEVKARALIGERRDTVRHGHVREGDIRVAPCDHLRIHVAAVHASLGKSPPVPKDATAPTAEVEECAQLLDRGLGISEHSPDQIRMGTAASQEEACIGMQRSDLGAKPGRREREAVVFDDSPSPRPRGRGDRELVKSGRGSG